MKNEITKLIAGAVASIMLSCAPMHETRIENNINQIHDKAKSTQKFKTPEKLFNWLIKNIKYTSDKTLYGTDHWASLKQTLKSHKGDCDDFAIAAAAKRCDGKNNAIFLGLYKTYNDIALGKNYDSGHAAYIFRQDNKLGVIDNNGFLNASYDNLEKLVNTMNKMRNEKDRYHNYTIYELACKDALDGNGNLKNIVAVKEGKSFFTPEMINFLRFNHFPNRVQRYLSDLQNTENPRKDDFFDTFIRVFYSKTASKSDAAIAAAVMMNDGSYPIRIAVFPKKTFANAAYIFEENGKFGSVSKDREFFRPAEYNSVDELIDTFELDHNPKKIISNREDLNLPPYPSF